MASFCAAIDRLAEAEGGTAYRNRLASIESLPERIADIRERHERRVARLGLAASVTENCKYWRAQDELIAAFAAADQLPARVAALVADAPDRELPPDSRPKQRPKATFMRQVY